MLSLSTNESFNTFPAIDSMKYSVPLLVLTLTLSSGCFLFPTKARKAAAQKEAPPATEIEAEFHDRWIERRSHELIVAGTAKTEAEAKAKASAEFLKQFPYIRAIPAKSSK
jgi:hypothetical protein